MCCIYQWTHLCSPLDYGIPLDYASSKKRGSHSLRGLSRGCRLAIHVETCWCMCLSGSRSGVPHSELAAGLDERWWVSSLA